MMDAADVERLPTQLEHFIYSYGLSARAIGVHLKHDPTRIHRYLKGANIPRPSTRRQIRAFMRRYRKSVIGMGSLNARPVVGEQRFVPLRRWLSVRPPG
jgi:hypothetical protein